MNRIINENLDDELFKLIISNLAKIKSITPKNPVILKMMNGTLKINGIIYINFQKVLDIFLFCGIINMGNCIKVRLGEL